MPRPRRWVSADWRLHLASMAVTLALLANAAAVGYGFHRLGRLADIIRVGMLSSIPAAAAEAGRQESLTPARTSALTVELYSDFDCQFCRASVEAVTQARKHFGDRVKWKYRYAANPASSVSMQSAAIGLCTEDQSGPWRLYALLGSVEALTSSDLQAAVSRIHPDPGAVKSCTNADSTRTRLWTEVFRSAALGRSRTPTLVVGGVSIVGKLSPAPLVALIEERLQASDSLRVQ